MNTPSIYNQNFSLIGANLLPPKRRLPIFLAWISVLVSPFQWLGNLIFNNYYSGFTGNKWNSGTTYAYGARVSYTDGCVYELINTLGLTSATPPPQDTVNWYKVLDTFIGAAERIKYTTQKVSLEYALNRQYSVISPSISPSLPFTGASHITQIYISNSNSGAGFFLSKGNSVFQGYMGNGNSPYQSYLGNSYSVSNFTIFVPISVDAAITAAQTSGVTSQQVVLNFASKYTQAGMIFNYKTY